VSSLLVRQEADLSIGGWDDGDREQARRVLSRDSIVVFDPLAQAKPYFVRYHFNVPIGASA
jgi:hypothetical protein